MRASQYFIAGCRDGTLLKHKLMCSKLSTLAALIAKADKYATADSTLRIKVSATDKPIQPPAMMQSAGEKRGQQNCKRKSKHPDP
ncbi:Endoglucanase 3 [Hordeum vulgare]|nr:Endoglucanase 3 [Hordeum vulgare]